jgi:transcription initiation factor TFIIB
MCPQLSPTAAVPTSSHTSEHPTTETEKPSSPSVNSGQTCPSCGAPVETVDTPEAVCRHCQTVVTTEPISTAPRPRYDDTGGEKTQAGSRVTLLYADGGLGTSIEAGATTDEDGATLSATQRRVFKHKGWTKRLRPQAYRLDYALGELRRIGAELNIPTSELECAAHLYREALTEGHINGRSADGFVAACLLAAVRQSSLTIPVSVREIRSVSRATREQARTARGVLELRLDVEIPPMRPQDFLPRATSMLSAPYRVEMCATKLLDARRSDETATESLSPRTLAAAALHAAFCFVDVSQRPTLEELSEVFEVSKSTISSRKGDLLQYRGVWDVY